ncbi:MAG: protein kinase [Syntrophobacteraceae bacterium]
MGFNELIESYRTRLKEARLYLEQGLREEATEIMRELLDEVEASSLPEHEKRSLRSDIKNHLDRRGSGGVSLGSPPEAGVTGASDLESPAQAFAYGLALMDGQFWEEAIRHFRNVAIVGHQVLESWEYCGDCATQLEKWDEAIRYYEILYSNPLVPDDIKQRILKKISKCSQKVRELASRPARRPEGEAKERAVSDVSTEEATDGKIDAHAHSMTPLDQTVANELLGKEMKSWRNEKGECLTGAPPRSYRIVNLVNVGMTSVVVEIEREDTGEKLVGQSVKPPFGKALTPKALARWTHAHLMMESPYLVQVFDLAQLDDLYFIVREGFSTSLAEKLSGREGLPIPLAISFAYQILEALGYLHLHMGMDKEIRKLYHLDLRPSRILIDGDKAFLKVANGGLWKEIEDASPEEANIRKLPLAVLPYRAPEQFRPYLARRRPPIFTDIYLFGMIFYEMLTGAPAFRAASYAEYEIQHCDQYPNPPKVWRPDVPDDLNDLVMKCLENDPTKRWRSSTQLSLLLEKMLSRFVENTKDDPCAKYMRRSKTL